MKRIMTVALAMTVLGLLACDKGSSGGASATSSASPGARASANGGAMGVKECDDYFDKVTACLDKDPSKRASVEPAMDATKKMWAAADPATKAATKATIAASCKTSLESFSPARCQ